MDKKHTKYNIHKELNLKFANGMQVMVWRDTEGVHLGIVNTNEFIVTDKKLTVSEEEALNTVLYKP